MALQLKRNRHLTIQGSAIRRIVRRLWRPGLRMKKDRTKTNGRRKAGSFRRASGISPQGFGKPSAGDEEAPNLLRLFPEEKVGFPERFPKSSRTNGCFSRTNLEQVPKKPARNTEEIWDECRIRVGDKQAKGRHCPEPVFYLSTTCLPLVFHLSRTIPGRCCFGDRSCRVDNFYLMCLFLNSKREGLKYW